MESKGMLLVAGGDAMLVRVLGDVLVYPDDPHPVQVPTVAEALAALGRDRVDAILLPGDLPDGTMTNLWADLRRRGYTMPVVIMTGEGVTVSVPDNEAEDGWDEVVCPVRPGTLAAVIRDSVGRDTSNDQGVVIGRFRLDLDGKSLEDTETETVVRLTEKETAILKYLAGNGPDPIGRDVLLEEVWGYNERVTTHTLETHVYRLRRKLEQLGPEGPALVHTEAGGYRLNAPTSQTVEGVVAAIGGAES